MSEAVKAVFLNTSSLIIPKGRTYTFHAEVCPTTASKSFNWESTNESVATIRNGVLTSLEVGSSTIIVSSAENSSIRDYCVLSVIDSTPVRYILIQDEQGNNQSKVILNIGEIKQFYAEVNPENATDKDVTWSINSSSIASVDSNGLVRAKSVGTATLTVYANDGNGAYQTCEIEVRQPVTNISIKNNNLNDGRANRNVTGFKGKWSYCLKSEVTPENAYEKSVIWSSSNTAFVSVNPNTGAFYGNNATGSNTVYIYAIAKDGSGVNSKINVKINDPYIAPTNLNFNSGCMTVSEGEEKTITLNLCPDSTSEKYVKVYSADPSIATAYTEDTKLAGKSVKITGQKPGSTRIYALYDQRGVYLADYCDITVTAAEKTHEGCSNKLIGIAGTFLLNDAQEVTDTSYTFGKCASHRDMDKDAWCDRFVLLCLELAGFLKNGITANVRNCAAMRDRYIEMGVYQNGTEGIQKGDIVFIRNPGRSETSVSHVAFALEKNSDSVYLISGNWSSLVSLHSIDLNKSDKETIIGYARPRYENA